MNTSVFDVILSRRHTNSYKWDTTPDDVIPMWVADMDFKTAPAIIEALEERVRQGIFGYTHVPDEYYQAVCRWFSTRHGLDINPGHIIYTSGVVPAISAILQAVCLPGESVIVQTPAYNCFFSSIRNNGCTLADNRLIYDKGRYSLDFENLEELARRSDVTALILCNPHNPSGRVWTPEELRRIGDICLENNVFVIADEIHCEIVYPGYRYTPYASLGAEYARGSATCISPSKAFNIAGLQIANIVVPNDSYRRRIDKSININEVCDVNPFGVLATIAAYERSSEWLDSLIEYLDGNRRLLAEHFERELPEFTLTPMEGTYLGWFNISCTGLKAAEVESILVEQAHVRLNAGEMYGPGGSDFLRINLALPRSVLSTALASITPVLRKLIR